MRSAVLYILISCLPFAAPCSFAKELAVSFPVSNNFFLENKGQIKDQNKAYRNDIQYVVQNEGAMVFISKGGLHYQFAKLISSSPRNLKIGKADPFSKDNIQSAQVKTYRIDVSLVGANTNCDVVASEKNSYYEVYNIGNAGQERSEKAETFRKITYKNIYPNIDWVLYFNANGHFKHEFIVGAFGDVRQIQLRYDGQHAIGIDNEGSLVVKSPMGEIVEQAPICYSSNGAFVASKYTLRDNVLSYDVAASNSVIVDPIIHWGTYYGRDSSSTQIQDVEIDLNKRVVFCGQTYSALSGSIATSGSYDAVIGGRLDAFVGMFDSLGNRMWASYFGGDSEETGDALAVDRLGNIYITGVTASRNSIGTSGTEQPSYGGGSNGYLAKFTNAGYRVWGTYLGARGKTVMASVNCDNLLNIYISGITNDTGLSTPSSFQPRKLGVDLFLIKYDTTGKRVWGTYYGGTNSEEGGASCVGLNGVYLTGSTFSTTGISTARSYQPSPRGGTDGFLVKFDFTGTRMWGTYVGGEGQEITGRIVSNKNYVYLQGGTQSDSYIATSGSAQSTRGGIVDAYLMKFETDSGMRQWGTYFGGPGDELPEYSFIACDDNDNVYITGKTSSRSGIATAGSAWQTTYGGGNDDAYAACFASNGRKRWSSYHGGTGDDIGFSCAFDMTNASFYLVGQTGSPNNIATSGSHLDRGGGLFYNRQGYITKFRSKDTVLPTLQIASFSGNNESDIHLIPNPTSGKVVLLGSIAANSKFVIVKMYDLRGQVVYERNVPVQNGKIAEELNLDSFIVAGRYIVKIISDTEVLTTQVIKY